MTLAQGTISAEVKQLQDFLNLLFKSVAPTLAPLNPDGKFGPLTKARVQEFQRRNGLVDNGIVDAIAMNALKLALQVLGLLAPSSAATVSAVRSINQQILGVTGPNNLVMQPIPSIRLISESTFRPGLINNKFSFRAAPPTVGRLGIFAAQKGGVERAVILLLPPTGIPDRVIICITQGFAQASATLDGLGWSNPLSPPFIDFVLQKHVVTRWGAQTLASRKQMAFVYIVRAKGKELGPFASDGPFMRQVLTELAALTGNGFTFDNVEAFTFSSGISDFNLFLSSIRGQLNVRAIYNIDPAGAVGATSMGAAPRKQFLSGSTGGPKAGFEFMPMDRWSNEPSFAVRQSFRPPFQFNYLHNHCMPNYILHLGLQTT